MHVALGVSSDCAASLTKLVNCHVAGLWLPFLTPHSPVMTAYPQTTVTLSCLSQSSAVPRGESLSPAPFSQDKLNFTSSGLIKLFVSKIVKQPWGKGEFSLSFSVPPPSELKPAREKVACHLSTGLRTPALQTHEAFEFCLLWSRLLAIPSPLQAQLKETYGSRFFNAIERASLLRGLADEMRFSKPLFVNRQNNKQSLMSQQRHSSCSVTRGRMCHCLCCGLLFYL